MWSWTASVSLSEPARDPNDATTEALVDLYRAASGEHPDWDEFRHAMVAEGRVVATFTPEHAYGMLGR